MISSPPEKYLRACDNNGVMASMMATGSTSSNTVDTQSSVESDTSSTCCSATPTPSCSFGDQQEIMLQDYIETSLMLQLNGH